MESQQDRRQQIIDKVHACCDEAQLLYSYQRFPKIKFDLRGFTMGYAKYSDHSIRFNLEALMADDSKWDHLLNDTVPHEVAHLVAMDRFPEEVAGRRARRCPLLGNIIQRGKRGQPHGPCWKRICIALGGSGERCHQEKMTRARGSSKKRTFQYITETGGEVWLSTIRHGKLQRGRYEWYSCRVKGKMYKAGFTGRSRFA